MSAAATLTDAICTRQWDWSETSQTVLLFTREMGLVRALAKGSKRPKAPFSGGIGLLTRAGASIVPRPELALLIAWDLEETFPALRRSLGAYHAGMYAADLVNHVLHERDPHPALYDGFVAALRVMDDPGAIPGSLLRLQWTALLETGYRPILELDPAEGAAAAGGSEGPRVFLFDPELGGVVPGDEAETVIVRTGRRPWRVRAETLSVLRALAETADGSATPPTAPAPIVHRANRLLAAYLRHILGRELPTTALVFGDDLPV